MTSQSTSASNILIASDTDAPNVVQPSQNESQVSKQGVHHPPQDLDKPPKLMKSVVWVDFERVVEYGPNGKESKVTAICKSCKKKLNGHSTQGTSHLKSHLKTCPYYKKKASGQQLLSLSSRSTNQTSKLVNWRFDQDFSRLCFARMVAKHDYPFNMTEHQYFREYARSLNPQVKFYSRNTIRSDVMKLYTELRGELQLQLDQLSSRVSLTTDLWTSDHQNIGYCCITCHFIDEEWKLHKKVIAYHALPPPHTGPALGEAIKAKALNWNIDNKLFTITVDNASNNDGMIKHVKQWLVSKGALPINGDLFHMRCCAHILNLIVQDGLKVVGGLLVKIRSSVDFTKSSESRRIKFGNALVHTKLAGKGLSYDVPTRWNSTYLMLESALVLRPAFKRLAELATEYKSLPTEQEWEIGMVVCECLKVFYDVTLLFSGVKYPTINLYFKGVCDVYESILSWESSAHGFIRDMAFDMKLKFEKYWQEVNLMMSISMVFDPRYKMTYIECFFESIHADAAYIYINKVRDSLYELFSKYESQFALSTDVSFSCTDAMDSGGSRKRTKLDERWRTYVVKKHGTSQVQKTELDKYLEDDLLPMGEDEENFDILMWWKTNGPKFPVMAKIARDILAVPVSTVPSEATFSSGGRIISESRSSLCPDIVEALSCTKDWLPELNSYIDELVDGGEASSVAS